MDYVPDKPNVFYAMKQRGPTCFIAAALNILLCTKALRHYMVKLLNAEGAADPGGTRGACRETVWTVSDRANPSPAPPTHFQGRV